MEDDSKSVNSILWGIGWHPFITMGSMATLGGLIGVGIMSINSSMSTVPVAIGLFAVLGGIVWFAGVKEVNDNFEQLVQRFVSKQKRKATQSLGVADVSTFSLLHRIDDSPVLVKPAKQYEHTVIVLGESSITIAQGATFDVQKRELTTGGNRRELFYDQISTVKTYDEGDYSGVQIGTGLDAIEIESVYTQKIQDAASDLRRRVRSAKNA